MSAAEASEIEGGAVEGSARRAFLAWRTTATAMLLLWSPVPFLTSVLVKPGDGFQDLAFVLLAMLAYCAAVLLIIPAFVFTVGRPLDRASSLWGLRGSVIAFGVCGLAFGIVMLFLLGLGALTPVGAVVFVFAPMLIAIAGRLFMELRGQAWFFIIWGFFVLAFALAFALIAALVLSAGA